MTAVLLSAGLSVIYLIVIRLLDFNEREPLWGIVLLFLLGWAAAGVVQLSVPTSTIELSTWGGAGWKEGAKFVAIVLGLGMGLVFGQTGALVGIALALVASGIQLITSVQSEPVAPTDGGSLLILPPLRE